MLGQFWKQYNQERLRVTALLQAMAKFPVLMGIGFGVIILSGISMMAMTRGVFGEQLWFRIKFGLIIAIIMLRLVGRKQVIKLQKTLEYNNDDSIVKMQNLKSRLSMFHYTQLALLFTIILLSVFKFN